MKNPEAPGRTQKVHPEGRALPLLAEVPMLQAIREGGDKGVPAAIGDEETAAAFHELARKVAIGLDTLETKAPPEIVFED